jgi:hypothetical protein
VGTDAFIRPLLILVLSLPSVLILLSLQFSQRKPEPYLVVVQFEKKDSYQGFASAMPPNALRSESASAASCRHSR